MITAGHKAVKRMHAVRAICVAGMLVLLGHSPAAGQGDRRPFNAVADAVERAIREEFPDWKRTSVPPLQPNGVETFPNDAIIDQWDSDALIIKISIIVHSSEEEAKRALGEFVARAKPRESLRDVGDESYVWGVDESISFRKGVYTVYVWSATVEQSPDQARRQASTVDRNSKRIARIVAKALKDQ